MKTRNCQPKLHVLDNKASKALKRLITTQNTVFQFLEAYDHRVNAAERAIRTFQCHFISGLTLVDPNFPLYLWCQLLEQAEITLNLLRASQTCPKISAYTHLHGTFDFMATPLAPPGCKSIIFEDPVLRKKYATHGKLGYYLGPTMDHYRSFRFYILETHGIRICNTDQFFPTQSKIPTIQPETAVIAATQNIIKTLKDPQIMQLHNLPDRHKTALQDLADLFNTNSHHSEQLAPRLPKNTTKPIATPTTIPWPKSTQSANPHNIP